MTHYYKIFFGGFSLLLTTLLLQSSAFAHCQVPCGIYDDAARVKQLHEDAHTISKAVTEMTTLAGKSDPQSINQSTRWVMTKESHADHIIEVVANYFLAQRVKNEGSKDAYMASLADHHAVIVAAMKAKQTADTKSVAALEQAIAALAKHYDSK